MRVLIAGGGVGGLEAALALRAHDASFAVTMLAPEPVFTYRAWSVATPFGHGAAVEVDLRAVARDRGFELSESRLVAVDATRRRAITDVMDRRYDALVLALGARPVPIVDGAFTFRGPVDAAALGDLLAAARGKVVAFVATASAVWSLPAYELALQTAAQGLAARVLLITAEPAPMHDFGAGTAAEMASLLAAAGVELHTETVPESFADGRLYMPLAGTIDADVVVALPAHAGRRVPGVPHDAAGFVEVDAVGRVAGLDDVFAIGDMTARPLKQGGLTAQQADVAAAAIAADRGLPVEVVPYEPVLRAMLLTGAGPRYLRHPTPPGQPAGLLLEAPWWPPHKIAGAHLGPYLATHAELLVTPSRG